MNSKTIKIGDFEVGGDKTFVIAEIGSNHNQDLQLVYDSIEAAKACGADAVKFQSLNVDELYHQPSQQIVDLHRKIDLREEWHGLLKSHCDKVGITFFSSPTYLKSLDILEGLDVPLYKLASAQIGTFPQMVEAVARLNKPTIISTGIVSYSELERVVNIFKRNGNEQYIILHCNSMYPTPYDQVNLPLMDVYHTMFGNPVGFSDHTDDIYVPIGAVARGAKVIEKHFAIDKTLPVPDAQFSLEPTDFKRMVDGIRAIEQACKAAPRTELHPDEASFKAKILYRLILKHDKQKGDSLTAEDFLFLRNAQGIDCREMDFVIDKMQLSKDVPANHLLQLEDLVFKGN